MFTDTDCLVYEIEAEDVYEDFHEGKGLFDFRSKFFDPVNKKIIGKMKDEFKGKIISEFVGLNQKMYSLVNVDGEEAKKAKGVNRGVARTVRRARA